LQIKSAEKIGEKTNMFFPEEWLLYPSGTKVSSVGIKKKRKEKKIFSCKSTI